MNICARPNGCLDLNNLKLLLQELHTEDTFAYIYYVLGLGKESNIRLYRICNITTIDDYWLSNAIDVTQGERLDDLSLIDSNVIMNDYNDHYCFTNRLAAEKYLDKCRDNKKLTKWYDERKRFNYGSR